MADHSSYWKTQMELNRVVAFGPVFDPKGAYGIAILRLDADMDPSSLTDMDPVIVAKRGFGYELFPMPSVVHPQN